MRYCNLKVVDPGFNPVKVKHLAVQDARRAPVPAPWFKLEDTAELASDAAIVLAPETLTDILAVLLGAMRSVTALIHITTVPEGPTVTVTDGPTVPRSEYVVEAVPSSVAITAEPVFGGGIKVILTLY